MPLSFWLDHFLDSRAKICQIFALFFGKFKAAKSHSEINWPLVKIVKTNSVTQIYSWTGANKPELIHFYSRTSWAVLNFVWYFSFIFDIHQSNWVKYCLEFNYVLKLPRLPIQPKFDRKWANWLVLLLSPKLFIPSTPNNSNETYTFMGLGRAGRFGQS